MIRKSIIHALGLILVVFSGPSFYKSRHLKEPVVIGPGVTQVKKLSAYFPALRGTANDENIYILEGANKGGAVLILGGSHPEEPAARLTTWLLTENAKAGPGPRLRPQFGQPERDDRDPAERRLSGQLYHPDRMGRADVPDGRPLGESSGPMARSRSLYPLSDAPEPGLHGRPQPQPDLAGPGQRHAHREDVLRPDRSSSRRRGSISSSTSTRPSSSIRSSAPSSPIRRDWMSRPWPPWSSRTRSSRWGWRNRRWSCRGLSHREIGDHTDAVPLLFETPEPFLDATRGRTDEKLLLEGKDEFVVRAGKRGLLFEKIDEKGWPIDVRVGRHCSTILQVLAVWSQDHGDKAVVLTNLPKYAEVIEERDRGFPSRSGQSRSETRLL